MGGTQELFQSALARYANMEITMIKTVLSSRRHGMPYMGKHLGCLGIERARKKCGHH